MYSISRDNQIRSLERKESYKDLGVITDEKLTFRDHIHDKINKAYAILGIIHRILQLIVLFYYTKVWCGLIWTIVVLYGYLIKRGTLN